MPVIRRPHVAGLILCERMEVDPQARKVSLVGIFNARSFRAFPARLRFTVYTTLYGGKGDGIIEVMIGQLATEEQVPLQRRPWNPPGGGVTTHVEFKVAFEFPAPGRYRIWLNIDNQELDPASRYLDVRLARGST